MTSSGLLQPQPQAVWLTGMRIRYKGRLACKSSPETRKQTSIRVSVFALNNFHFLPKKHVNISKFLLHNITFFIIITNIVVIIVIIIVKILLLPLPIKGYHDFYHSPFFIGRNNEKDRGESKIQLLSDQALLEAYKKANALHLDKEFIQLIKHEMTKRNLIFLTQKQP
ncbi:sporulation histidine kinase inhibitor Sda [Rossellomorea oryzaecorticis]|uniref:sporulation histidine kinase inhibitor Sda n=1 Tax=Rossellomorea oryzaecorticis TaxID=1396505 RepID=UPI003CCB423D